MIIEIQYLKERSAFRIDIPEKSIQNIVASALDDNSVNVSILFRDKEEQS